MTQYSFPWDDVNGDRLYNAKDFMRFFAAFLKTGVVMSFKSGLRVRSSQNGMNIQVEDGASVINGGSYINDESIAIQVNVASSIQDRKDSVVLRMDNDARNTYLYYKASDTTVIRNDTVFELQLAVINVKMNATQITDADITDMRSNPTICGWATPFDNINVDGLVEQYRSIFSQADLEFQEWFLNLQNQLDDNQLTNLQKQIDALKTEINNSVHDTGINLDGQDLNMITTPGIYFSLGNAPLSNAPRGAGKNSLGYQFSLVTVIKSAKSSQVRQIFYDSYESSTSNGDNLHNERKTYTRVGQGSPVVWGAWFEYAMIDESGLLTVKDLEVTGSLTKSTDTPFTKLPIKSGIPFAGNVYYRIKSGVVYINGYLTPTGNVGAGSVTTIATLPIELAPKPEFAGSGSVFLASSDLNGGTRGATGTLVGSDGNIIISSSVAQTTVSRFGFFGSYPIE